MASSDLGPAHTGRWSRADGGKGLSNDPAAPIRRTTPFGVPALDESVQVVNSDGRTRRAALDGGRPPTSSRWSGRSYMLIALLAVLAVVTALA